MTDNKTPPERKPRKLSPVILATCMLVVLPFAASIPFLYESTTLWYKFGLDRSLLLSGQVIGVITVVLLGYQLILGARVEAIVRIIGTGGTYALHRLIGLLIMLSALAHALLILIPEGLENLPFGLKYWPEHTGLLSLMLIGINIFTAFYHAKMGIRIQTWRRFHRIIGYSIFLVVNFHVLFVSTSFAQGTPRHALLLFSGTTLVIIIFQKKIFSTRRSISQ